MSDPRRLDILRAIVHLRTSTDERPCVLLTESREGIILVAPMSSALDLYNPAVHFLIRSDDAEFSATGLVKTSFVLGDSLRELRIVSLTDHIGRLQGDLAKRFDEWIG